MKYKFEQLINRSYEAIKKRGLITNKTTLDDFFDKIDEERDEILNAYTDEELAEELNDLATVCMMCIIFIKKNPIKEFEKGVIKNEKRAALQEPELSKRMERKKQRKDQTI